MKSFEEFLNEKRVSNTAVKVKPKVTKQELRDLILNGGDPETVDYSDITDMSWMFKGCSSLENIEGDFHLYDWTSEDAPKNPILREKYPELFV